MPRKLRFSERKKIAESGTLGPLQDESSDLLRNVIVHLVREASATWAGRNLYDVLRSSCIEHFGWTRYEADRVLGKILDLSEEDFLDFLELFAEWAKMPIGSDYSPDYPMADIEERLNRAFERHRYGYRIEKGEIRKIGSPALDEEIVGPALLAIRRPGWEEVERSFREAIQHQRGGADENDDALTAANAAVEAALKATGFKGANLGPLTKDFKKSSYVPAELKGVPEALDSLIGRSGALRNSYGDSHGKASGSNPVPQALVDLAIYWAAAFIVYLGETSKDEGSGLS